MVLSIFMSAPDPGLRLPRALRKDTLFAGRRAVLCRLKHPLARATSLKELVDAEWITTSITPKAEKELGALFKRHGLVEPKLALRSQSALTLLTCLAHTDLLAMAPAQWTLTPFANRILTAIPVGEELSAPPIIAVRRADVPPSPAAGYLLDLIERVATKLGPR
jgi:LysR family transcriptional regulator of abg operon